MDRRIVEQVVGAMLGGDLDRLATMLADDVTWHLPPFAGRPPLQGRDAVLAFLESASRAFYEPGSVRFEPCLVVAGDAGGSALGRLSARTRKGSSYENLYSFSFRFRDRQVVEAWELLDSAHFLRQLERADA